MRIPTRILHAVPKTVPTALLLSAACLQLPGYTHEQARLPTKSSVKRSIQQDQLAAFLEAPIDLVAFKKKKGGSNSGSVGTTAKRWFYRPTQPGFLYQYVLFATPEGGEGQRFDGFSVVVYKFGKTIGRYEDTNEMLVAIWCRLRDPDLGQADFVGTRVSDLKSRFGEPFATIGDVLVYQQGRRALSVNTKGGIVAWYKYLRLSREIDAPGAVPELLLRPGPEW
jgi:hypothetical protein